ncbi:MAG: MATE family efflux transporter [Oscillospiraceae bacterium]|nr:MATE family efflux transporter [Oscillospiraceae bacterium]
MSDTKASSKQMDMLNGSIGDKILYFAIPLAVTGILQQLFNAADIAVIGRFVGKNAMAAVGSNSPITALIINLFTGISIGANVVIARFIGQNHKEGVKMTVHTALLFAVLCGTVFAVICEVISRPILSLMSIPDNVFDMALLYFRVYIGGMPVILLYNFASAIFRSQGNTKTPLICLLISGIINVLFNLFFVLVLKMTVNGVALATVLSNLISSALLIFFLTREDSAIHFSFKDLRIDWRTLREMIRIGLPAGIQGMVFSFSNIIIQSSINKLGEDVMAASSAAFNLEIFAYYIINAFGQACTTFVGQNYGAGKSDRCLKATRLSLIQDLIFTAVLSVIILLTGKYFLMIFNDDPVIADIGMIRLKYIVGAEVINVVIEIVSGCMRGYGHSFVPALMCTAGICGVRIIWSCTAFKTYPSFDVLMTAYPLSWLVTAAALVISYFWMKKHALKNFFASVPEQDSIAP